MKAIRSSETSTQDLHGATSQNTAFFDFQFCSVLSNQPSKSRFPFQNNIVRVSRLWESRCKDFVPIFLDKQWSSIRAEVYIAQMRTKIIFNSSAFWVITLLTPVKNSACSFAAYLLTVSYLAYSSTLKMEMILSSETSVDFCWTTLRYSSENINLHNEGCENFRAHIKLDSPDHTKYRPSDTKYYWKSLSTSSLQTGNDIGFSNCTFFHERFTKNCSRTPN
jgi:hypothetical protein